MQEKFIHYRTPLEHTYRKLTVEKKLNVVYFGGSITHGHGSSDIEKKSWRALSVKWLKDHFPEAQINDVRAAIGESGTFLGVYRLERDVLSQKPDLLFIEFAVNDLSHETSEEMAAMQYETIVREVKKAYQDCDIVTLLTESWGTAKMEGLFPAAKGHEKISEYYGISTLWVGKSLIHQLPEITKEEWEKYFIDTVHPNDHGYEKYYQCVEEFLKNSLLKKEMSENKINHTQELPNVYSKFLLDGNRIYKQCTRSMLKESLNFMYTDENFLNLPKTPYVGYVYTKNEDSFLVYSFCGTEAGIYSNFYDKEEIEYSIDDKPWQRMFCSVHNPTVIVQHLKAGEHTLKVRPFFADKENRIWKIGAVFSRDESEQTLHDNRKDKEK